MKNIINQPGAGNTLEAMKRELERLLETSQQGQKMGSGSILKYAEGVR
jgi:hypothetical protein